MTCTNRRKAPALTAGTFALPLPAFGIRSVPADAWGKAWIKRAT